MYATGYAFNTKELFLNFPTDKLKITSEECSKINGDKHKKTLSEQIFLASAAMIIDDIIDNNATFRLPTRSKKAELGIKTFNREEFTKCRQNGKFKEVNFLNSNFCGYQMNFKFQSAGVMREKLVYLDPAHKNRLTDNVNKGKSYY